MEYYELKAKVYKSREIKITAKCPKGQENLDLFKGLLQYSLDNLEKIKY